MLIPKYFIFLGKLLILFQILNAVTNKSTTLH